MGLKCGIIGLANTGKTTIFNCISGTKAESSSFAFGAMKSNIGMVNVPDLRLDELVRLVETKKVVPATVDIVDIPGLAKGASKGEGVGNKFLSDIRNSDALIHVLRCYDDENLPHIEGSVDPVRDMELVDIELQVKDLESIEKKMVKVEKVARVGDKDAKKELEVLIEYKKHLEDMQPVRTLKMDQLDKKCVEDIALLTEKPVLYVCNVDESSAVDGNAYVAAVKDALKEEDTEVIIIAGALEEEISELEEEEDRKEFLKDAGLSEPGVNKLIRSSYELLKLNTFFTVGPKEIRAWTIKEGATAPEAAGVIHSDLQRGFIRAEVIKYADFTELKSENACKEKGKLSIEGKNYIVDDGDLLNIRFNV